MARVASADSFVPLGAAAQHVLLDEGEIEKAATSWPGRTERHDDPHWPAGVPGHRSPAVRGRTRHPGRASATSSTSGSSRTSPTGTRTASPTWRLIKEAGALGLLGMHLTGYGCAGTNAVSYGLACLELEAGDSGVRSMVSVQGSLAMFAIWKFGSEEQKQTWLPGMAAGELIGCFGLTEPDFGSNPAGMRTRAAPRRRRLGAQRHQDVDHQRLGRRRGDRLGPDQRRPEGHPRLRRADRHPGLLRAQDRQEAVAAGLGHLGVDLGGRPAARRRRPARGDRARAARCPASTRPGSASSSARSARPATAWRPRSTTPAPARCSAGR